LQRTLPTLAVVFAFAFAAAPASAGTAQLSFEAAADTYVASSYPTTSYGSSTSLYAQGTSAKQAFLRFDVWGIDGRTVTGARLRIYSKKNAVQGGTVFGLSSNDWTESMTWGTRPAIDGPQLGGVGATTVSTYYDIELAPGAVVADGAHSFALTSTAKSSSQWGSRETTVGIPRLIVDVQSDDWLIEGLLPVASGIVGSGDATSFGPQHRLARTAGGRLMTIHGRHGSGVQLAWRDAGGNWQTHTRGATLDGSLLAGTGTGDWPSSIAVAQDSSGAEHAWVVMSGSSASKVRPVYMRRLSELDSADGPAVGPLVVLDAPSGGAYQPDIAFGLEPDGTTRGAVTWLRRNANGLYEQVVAWLDSLDTDTPHAVDLAIVGSGTSSSQRGTLVYHDGMRLVTRTPSSKLALRSYDYVNRMWTTGPSGMTVAGYMSATTTGSEVVAVAETSTTNRTVRVQRLAGDGTPVSAELTLNGYRSPTITTDGSAITILMVRMSDGSTVSRTRVPGLPWPTVDTVEVQGSLLGGPAVNPNVVRRADGWLRMVFGAPGATGRGSVYSFERQL
jgi:hypothetical protein